MPASYALRYLCYCRAYNMTPEQMTAHDKALFPGGKMCGFIIWISKRRDEYLAMIRGRETDTFNQNEFDRFLDGFNPNFGVCPHCKTQTAKLKYCMECRQRVAEDAWL